MSELNANLKQVNGPVNAIRLVGSINGMDKVIYLFADFHVDVTNQTTCKKSFCTRYSKLPSQEFFKNEQASKTYDFFVEDHPDHTQHPINSYPDIPELITRIYIFKKFLICSKKFLHLISTKIKF